MVLRELKLNELEQIYNTHMVKDFPPAELKKWPHLVSLAEAGVYFALGYFEGETLMAYALFLGPRDRKTLLLDYYAVTAASRGQGIGSSFLAAWQAYLKDTGFVIAEVEHPDFAADDRELQIRERRIAFYERNGMKMTGVQSKVFGVEYRVLYLPIRTEQNDEQVCTALDQIYHLMHPVDFPEDKIFSGIGENIL